MHPDSLIAGTLHIFIAFDWGDEIDLEEARKRTSASGPKELTRRRRTPQSMAFRPPPLYIDLPAISIELEGLGRIEAAAGLTLFDIGAVTLALRVPFQMGQEELLALAGSLAAPGPL